MERPGHRQRDGAAQSAAQHSHPAQVLHVGGEAQRTHKVLQAVPLPQFIQGEGSAADLLVNDGNQPILRAGDGQRNPLSLLVHPQDDELTCPCLCSYQWGIHRDLADLGGQRFFLCDLKLLHFCASSLKCAGNSPGSQIHFILPTESVLIATRQSRSDHKVIFQRESGGGLRTVCAAGRR